MGAMIYSLPSISAKVVRRDKKGFPVSSGFQLNILLTPKPLKNPHPAPIKQGLLNS